MTAPTTIDEYIATYPADVQKVLQKVRATIKTAAASADESIGYGIPTFKLNGKNLVHFGGFAHHIGFYPSPSAIVAFNKELAPYKQAKGSVQFPLDQPIPYDLIKRIVQYRVKELT